MSLALKRVAPKIYLFLKKFEKYYPKKTMLWDNKKYNVNLKICSMISTWRSFERLKIEADKTYEIYEGGDVIDVGAYHGFFSFLLAPKNAQASTYLSCEPHLPDFKQLEENKKILKKIFKNIKFINISDPIGDGNDIAKIKTPFDHFKYTNTYKGTNHEEVLKSKKIDTLVEEIKLEPKLIKIDVEGAELDVLSGMSKTIKNFRPIISIEKHPSLLTRENMNSIDNLFMKLDYQLDKKIFEDDIAINEIWKKKI